MGPMDDAALLRPESGDGLVFTVDFITPIVDSPEDFGAIAAANALSDVYAMGGEPKVALAIAGFPGEPLPLEILGRIFKGGRDKAAEAGCAIVGGHTVLDPELKYGLCVLGTVDPEHSLAQNGARPGDRLVLTKPIGLGIAAQAIKAGRLSLGEIEQTVDTMKHLNRGAAAAARKAGANAATDVTGFGLLGHLHHLALAAGCGARVDAESVPVFDFARELARQGAIPGGSAKNLGYVSPHATFSPSLGEPAQLVLADAQTSGGLLIAVAPENEATLLGELEAQGTLSRAVIGQLVDGFSGSLVVKGPG